VSAVDCVDVSASPELEELAVFVSEGPGEVSPSAEEGPSASVEVGVDATPDAEPADALLDFELSDALDAVLAEDVSGVAVSFDEVSPPFADGSAELSAVETPTDAPALLELLVGEEPELPVGEELERSEDDEPLPTASVDASA
jgi:hypothetical protein